MHGPSIFDIRDEFELICTGETEVLAQKQDEFYGLFSQMKDDANALETVWEYYSDTFDKEDTKVIFFDKVGEIHSIPSYKYVLKYLFLRYKISIGSENEADFFAYLESENWTIKRRTSEQDLAKFKVKLNRIQAEAVSRFEEEDHQMLLSVLLNELQRDYQKNGMKKEIRWGKYIKNLLFHFELKYLNDLALALHMEYSVYRVFRKKVLKHSEMNFYDRESIFVYLVLNYADICSIHKYFDAYRALDELYPHKSEEACEEMPDTTKQIGRWFMEYLEEDGQLKACYKKTLFVTWDKQLAKIFAIIDAVTRKNSKRSAEKVFLEQWKQLESYIDRYEKQCIFERILLDKEHERVQEMNSEQKRRYESELFYVGKQKIYEWLYGTNVIKRVENRNIERKDQDMRLLGNGQKDYFLNSKIFLETRIRDNTFSAFPLDEERQRNLLLTLGFINFVLESRTGEYLAESYEERLADFEIHMYQILVPCGFTMLHSGNAYDAFIKLLLSCDEPIELFKYIWREKTDSME